MFKLARIAAILQVIETLYPYAEKAFHKIKDKKKKEDPNVPAEIKSNITRYYVLVTYNNHVGEYAFYSKPAAIEALELIQQDPQVKRAVINDKWQISAIGGFSKIV